MAIPGWLWAIVGIGVVALLIGSFAPIPGYYNVKVDVTSQEISLIAVNVFSISSVSGSVTGSSTVIDWAAGSVLGIGLPAVEATFKMTVCLNPGNHCTSKSQSQWFPTLPLVNGQKVEATNSFIIGYVPAGHYTINVDLTQSGSSVATGSGSVCVGGGC